MIISICVYSLTFLTFWCIRAHLSLIINSSSAIVSDQKRIRAHLSLIINGLSAIGSEQKCFWTQLGLIRDHFGTPYFFIFCLVYWEMLALPRGNNKAAFWSETHLNSDSSDQKNGIQLIAKAAPLRRKIWLTEDQSGSDHKCFERTWVWS